MKLIIHTDGGSRGNPGKGACAFVIEAEDKTNAEKIRETCGKYLGVVTNNEAEYQAVLEALKWVLGKWGDKGGKGSWGSKGSLGGIEEILFKSDSLLLVSQLTGKWKIKDRELQKLVIEVKKMERELGCPVRYLHIPRELNREADREVNRILDSQINQIVVTNVV